MRITIGLVSILLILSACTIGADIDKNKNNKNVVAQNIKTAEQVVNDFLGADNCEVFFDLSGEPLKSELIDEFLSPDYDLEKCDRDLREEKKTEGLDSAVCKEFNKEYVIMDTLDLMVPYHDYDKVFRCETPSSKAFVFLRFEAESNEYKVVNIADL